MIDFTNYLIAVRDSFSDQVHVPVYHHRRRIYVAARDPSSLWWFKVPGSFNSSQFESAKVQPITQGPEEKPGSRL
jgi:hypothetical protein